MIVIPLTPAKLNLVAIIDDRDAASVLPYNWHVKIRKHRNGRLDIYAARWITGGPRRRIAMHQHLLGDKPGFEIDHHDGDGLNNRRKNLRFCTKAQNQWNGSRRRDNVSGFKGVTFDRGKRIGRKRWKASIQFNHKRINLGRYLSPREAADAYDAAALKLFGEFSRTNRDMLTDEQGDHYCIRF